MKEIRKIVDMVIEWLCCGILILMVALVAWQVFTRYILGNPSVTSESVARYMFVWLIFLALAYVFGRRGHMAINFVIDKLKPENRLKIDTLNQVIQIVFSGGILVYGGLVFTISQMVQLDAVLQIPMGLIYMVIPISGCLVIFYTVCNILENLNQLKKLKEAK